MSIEFNQNLEILRADGQCSGSAEEEGQYFYGSFSHQQADQVGRHSQVVISIYLLLLSTNKSLTNTSVRLLTIRRLVLEHTHPIGSTAESTGKIGLLSSFALAENILEEVRDELN